MPLATSSDQLLRIEAETGILDTSYAAAWNLGRYLALNSRTLVKALVNWKRSHAHDVKQKRVQQLFEMASVHENLPIQQQLLNEESPSFELPGVVRQAIENCLKLAEVPMVYLVPDNKMLPKESLRFFKVDKSWTTALLNGVFEVGFSGLSAERDNALWNQFYTEKIKKENVYLGYIMRSQLLVDFPTVELIGLDKDKNIISPVRVLREGDMAMVLFNQTVAEVIFSMPDHSMHAGFEHRGNPSELVLVLKNPNKSEEVSNKTQTKDVSNVEVTFLSKSQGIIDIPKLAEKIPSHESASLGSAELAYHVLKKGTAFSFKFGKERSN
ncbi:hypothetical protein C9994_09870 [Marivirga lumbricoides]|uniref:Uncharacterized protein n=1 Tax=Marivirga lumbricoides TaxID=1046115 RepID=A0A2T4DQ00_9BACT|nr:hypothetical protein C9994_09870 [Marivirga lumbricoides]